jgi:cytoskeleton protein RodZ
VSAMPHEHEDGHGGGHDPDGSPEDGGQSAPAGAPVVVRRNAGLAALIGAAASAIAIAYLWRATDTGAVLDWVLCLVMAVIAGFYLSTLVDARTPLVVADDLGVRIRLGSQWRGLPWDAVREVVVQSRRGLLRDGRLVFAPHSPGRALEGLEPRGRRQAALNQRLYGAALAVPMGLTTRVSQDDGHSLGDRLARLARGRADVLLVEPEPEPADIPRFDQPQTDEPDPEAVVEQREVTTERAEVDRPGEPVGSPTVTGAVEPPRRSLLGGIGTIVSRFAKGRGHDVDTDPAAAVSPGGAEAANVGDFPAPGAESSPETGSARSDVRASAVPLRSARPALRAQITHDAAAQAAPEREGRPLTRPGSVDLVIEPVPERAGVRPIALIGDAVEPLVIDGFVTEPAYDPVIGPELAAARTRVGLSVDDLAERTRIRPHVIESIEVDDFAPCGGDFYARGHLRTLARVLGQDVGPLLEQFDARYATAPINARRVFEAELATGTTGSMRRTVGGPNWALLVGVVLSLALVWAVVRLFATEPVDRLEVPGVVLNGSAGVDRSFGGQDLRAATRAMPVTVVAGDTRTRVVVRDRHGKVVFAGVLAPEAEKKVRAAPPVRVRADDAGDVHVLVRGEDRGTVGKSGQPGRRTFHRSAAR